MYGHGGVVKIEPLDSWSQFTKDYAEIKVNVLNWNLLNI